MGHWRHAEFPLLSEEMEVFVRFLGCIVNLVGPGQIINDVYTEELETPCHFHFRIINTGHVLHSAS